jgi:hypothetical protein
MQQVVNQQVRLQWCWYQLALAVQRTYRSVERWAFFGHRCTGIIKRLQHIKYSICLQQTVETHRSGAFVKNYAALSFFLLMFG